VDSEPCYYSTISGFLARFPDPCHALNGRYGTNVMGFMTGFGATLLLWTTCLLAGLLPQQRQGPPPPSALPLQLVGLIANKESPAKSACLIRCKSLGEKWRRLEVGQNACDVAEIQEIRQDSVIIRNLRTNRLELLELSRGLASTEAQSLPPAPAVTVAPGGVVVDLAAPALDYYVANLSDVLKSALATPHYRKTDDGQRVIDGYEMGQVTGGGVVDQMGLQNGDVILDVNGQPLDGVLTVVRILGQVQNMTQTKMTVLRDGQRITFTVNVK
jgi:type II secretory pathway component PulC